jgi:tol-pal system protein YbgF
MSLLRFPWTRALPALCLGASLLMAAAAQAQQPAPGATPQRTQPRAGTPPAAAAPAATEAPRGDSALRQRLEQLEEQMVDMQQAVGTLDSIARSGGAGAQRLPAMAPAGADSGRLEALEAQVRSLTQQVEALARDLRAQGGPAPAAGRASAPPAAVAGGAPAASSSGATGGFATTVTTDRSDPIGQIIGAPGATGGAAAAPTFTPPPAGADGRSAKDLYEVAYGLLLQQDYAAAEAGFEDFLRRFPNDALAGNAQYWLGETHYVRGNYKASAGAFLKGYQAYGRSSKAPDSLLKLAMSLDRLGQRDAACSSYGELTVKFPNAPQAVRGRADQERRRLGCV